MQKPNIAVLGVWDLKHSHSGKTNVKTLIIFAVCLSVPFIAIWQMVRYVTNDVFLQQKRDHLMSITKFMDTYIGEGGYNEILVAAGAENGTKEEQLMVLNKALREVTRDIAKTSKGLGVGYYSKDLDAMITYEPYEEFADKVGTSIPLDHPGRVVMATGQADVQMGSMVRGEIMNAMYPIIRGGEVIGYAWSNELVSQLEAALNKIFNIIVAFLAVSYIAIIIISAMFMRKMVRTEQDSLVAAVEASSETQRIDGLMHIVTEAVSSLLTADQANFAQALQNCMQMMAAAFEVDQISVWQYFKNEDRENIYTLTGQFKSNDGSTDANCTNSQMSEIVRKMGWQSELSENQTIKIVASQLKEKQRQKLMKFGVQSFTAVPVFLHDTFWGFVSFSSFRCEREFSRDEEVILLSGSLLMTNALDRNEMVQRIVRAKEEALAGTKAKSVFLASMSHEIRTPINAIIGMSAIGKSSKDPDRKDYAFEKIEDASVQLLGVINDVLDLSKIESGKLELSPVEFDFECMLKRIVGVTSHRMDEKDQSFSIQIGSDVPKTLISDDQRLTQVISNLLSNAIKFTPQNGRISISVCLMSETDETCTLRVEVADTGIGITPEQQKKIFNSFEQAESTTTRKFGGTGLGLSISKKIVECMGGRIWCESEEGVGSTFIFEVEAEKSSKSNDTFYTYNSRWANLNLLIVSTDETVLEYFSQISQQFQIAYTVAQTSAEALDEISGEHSYDICFISRRFDSVGGIELAKIIHRHEAGLPLVMITSANKWDSIVEAADEAGITTILPKPLFPSSVVTCIKECFASTTKTEDECQNAAHEVLEEFAGMHILLAEDIAINREIFMALLEPTGLIIDCAENGVEAVRMFAENPEKYDLIFMDVQMPEMDGYEATRKIRLIGSRKAQTVPIIAITANVFKEDIEACLESGMNSHVGKPMELDDVMEKLHKYLRG